VRSPVKADPKGAPDKALPEQGERTLLLAVLLDDENPKESPWKGDFTILVND